MNTTTYKLTGNTYNNRAEIKSFYATWNAAEKAWYIEGHLLDSTIWSLRGLGVKVEIV